MTAPALEAREFARLMAAFEPFEAEPRLALAVSGGADSTALAVLASRWVHDRGGTALAFVVDHRLRPESTREAGHAARRCRELGLETRVLTRRGAVPATAVEATARGDRYRLLGEACRHAGCLHLLTGHHADDQAETVAMRRGRGSGPLGLAGMSACVERGRWRLLRPLLTVSKARLVATLASRGLAWIDDPMNRDPRFARARLRRSAAGMPPLPPAAAADDRAGIERRLAGALPGLATLDRFGVARLDLAAWRRLSGDLRTLAVARVALAVGGRDHAPASARCATLARNLGGEEPWAATLGRCLWRWRGDRAVVTRELRGLPGAQPLRPHRALLWDGRFRVTAAGWGLEVVPLGEARDCLPRELLGRWRRRHGLPAAALAALPAVRDLEGLRAVPHLGIARGDAGPGIVARYAPRQALTPPTFAAAPERRP